MDGPKSEEKRDRDTCLKKIYAFWVLQLFKSPEFKDLAAVVSHREEWT